MPQLSVRAQIPLANLTAQAVTPIYVTETSKPPTPQISGVGNLPTPSKHFSVVSLCHSIYMIVNPAGGATRIYYELNRNGEYTFDGWTNLAAGDNIIGGSASITPLFGDITQEAYLWVDQGSATVSYGYLYYAIGGSSSENKVLEIVHNGKVLISAHHLRNLFIPSLNTYTHYRLKTGNDQVELGNYVNGGEYPRIETHAFGGRVSVFSWSTNPQVEGYYTVWNTNAEVWLLPPY